VGVVVSGCRAVIVGVGNFVVVAVPVLRWW
jgi:hypothetical protein